MAREVMAGTWAHGLSAYRNGRCRCATCREANRVRQAADKAARHARRVLVDGRLVAPVPADRHGLVSTYMNHGCRCEPCGAAESRRGRAARRLRQQLSEAAS